MTLRLEKEPGALLERLLAVRRLTETLAAPLSEADQQLQSMASASPTKWHRAHTTWFFEQLVLGPLGEPPYDPRFAFLYNSYYESLGPRAPRPARGLVSRPSAAEIGAYRAAVDGRLERRLNALSPEEFQRLSPLLELGIAHEQQHQELLLTDILHAFHQNPLKPAYLEYGPVPAAPALQPSELADPFRFHGYEGGVVWLGAVEDGAGGFAFDNERPRHRRFLEPYELAEAPLRVRDVVAFIRDGGYREPRHWLSEGLDWVRAQRVEAPLYWRLDGEQVWAFTHAGEQLLDPDEPALFLSFYEADALARWAGARLPTEAEWEHAVGSSGTQESAADQLLQTRRAPRARPLRATGALAGVFGTGWEWTSSGYEPYPGFQPAAGAVGEYNGKFMVNQLVLRGGSLLTPRAHVRATYRNFWHPDTRFQATAVRLARPLSSRSETP